jgi:hypothetical protein
MSAVHLGSASEHKWCWIVALLACGATAGCGMLGGSPPVVAGNWSSPGAKFQLFELQLQQNGDRVTGVACYIDSGRLVFSGAPVSGTLPDIRFQVTAASTPCCPSLIGMAFAGKHEEDRSQIAGEFGDLPLRFNPATTGTCGGVQPPL